jgi:hypothetical protein
MTETGLAPLGLRPPRAFVSLDDAGGQEPELQVQGVRVLVRASDEETARQVLASVTG